MTHGIERKVGRRRVGEGVCVIVFVRAQKAQKVEETLNKFK